VHIQATPKNLILTLTSYPNALLSLRSAKESVSFLSVDKKSTDADFKWGGLPNLHSGAKSAQGELDRLAQDLTTYVNTPLNVQNVLCWTTPAKLNLKLSKYTAFTLAQNFARQVQQLGCSKAEVRMKGLGMVKAYCVRGLRTGLSITRVRDITPVPHNGCRPPKQRRI
jgi:small subunit ribosomal protein S11